VVRSGSTKEIGVLDAKAMVDLGGSAGADNLDALEAVQESCRAAVSSTAARSSQIPVYTVPTRQDEPPIKIVVVCCNEGPRRAAVACPAAVIDIDDLPVVVAIAGGRWIAGLSLNRAEHIGKHGDGSQSDEHNPPEAA